VAERSEADRLSPVRIPPCSLSLFIIVRENGVLS